MGSIDNQLIQAAHDLDLFLDEALGEESSNQTPTSWDDLIERNGLDPVNSKLLTSVDHVFYSLLGVTAGVVDLTWTYDKLLTNEDRHQKFDSLSKKYIKKVTGQEGNVAIDNRRGGQFHRLIGPTHDLTRFFEAIRQIMKGEFRAEYLGRLFLDTSYGKGTAEYLKIESPVDAAFILILHLIGDFFSKMSLPIPGRSEAIKTDDKEIYKEIIREYMGHERDGQAIQRPENLRTQISRLLSNFTGSILISVVLRIYRYFSIFLLEKQSFSLSGLKLSDDMTYHLMNRNAQTIAFVISSGKAVFTGQPLDLNYLSFVQLVRSGASVNRLLDEERKVLADQLGQIINDVEAL